jgi:aminoglycoside 3'-phosphotransferase I
LSEVDREEVCEAARLPACLSVMLADYGWSRDAVGESGGAVFRLHSKSDSPDLYLKHGSGAVADDITDEMSRLCWLAGRVPVPAVKNFVRTPMEAWLLIEAMPGKTAYQMLEASHHNHLDIVDALAAFLRRLHAIPVCECPFNSAHTSRLTQARARIDAGLIDVDDFDDERQGWSADQVWEAMQSQLPLAPDPVVTHGDFSLDNLLMQNGEVVGCIDVGRLGIADRYQDLAIIWNCLGEFDSSLQERFWQKYGVPEVDERKLEFHLLLDELF